MCLSFFGIDEEIITPVSHPAPCPCALQVFTFVKFRFACSMLEKYISKNKNIFFTIDDDADEDNDGDEDDEVHLISLPFQKAFLSFITVTYKQIYDKWATSRSV